MKKRFLVGLAGLAGFGLWLLRPGRNKPHLAPTTERDGTGPVTMRRYWVDVSGAKVPPEIVTETVLNRFSEIMPKPLATTFKQKFPPTKWEVC